MNQKKKRSGSRGTYILIIVLLVITVLSLLVAGWALLNRSQPEQPTPPEQTQPTETVVQNPDSISIPGYEAISFQADARQQAVALKNPPQNMCLFQITLCLEDGTVLWVSDYIAPGEISENIVLNQPLAEGTYSNAVLRYACFTMDPSPKPLNGAETKLTLRVNK